MVSSCQVSVCWLLFALVAQHIEGQLLPTAAALSPILQVAKAIQTPDPPWLQNLCPYNRGLSQRYRNRDNYLDQNLEALFLELCRELPS